MKLKKTHIVNICFCILLIISCSKNRDKSSNLIININPNEATKIKLNSWFKRIELIPLETTNESVITGCFKMIDAYSRFYIQDQRQHAIFVFSKTGKFLFSTKYLLGKGPKQYSSLVDFDINRFTNNMEILDAIQRKIKIYDSNGGFINAISLAPELLPLGSFIAVTKDIYLFYTKSGHSRDESLLFYSINKKQILKMTGDLPAKARYITSTNFTPFYLLNNQVHFSHIFSSNSLYSVNSESLEIENIFELNFGKYNLTLDDLPDNKDKEFYSSFMRNNNNRYTFVVDKKECEKYLLIFFYFNQKQYVAKYDKITKQLIVCYFEYNLPGQLLPPNITENNTLYYVAEPRYVKYVIDSQLLDIDSQSILTKIKEDDNPVIVKYILK